MKAIAIEHKETGLFQPAVQRENGEIEQGPIPAKRFATECEAVEFAEPYIDDLVKMRGRIFRLKPHRVIVPLTAVGIGVWVGNFEFTLAMSFLAVGLWWVLRNDESRLGLWVDSLFGTSTKGSEE